jgi:hypothetical protein
MLLLMVVAFKTLTAQIDILNNSLIKPELKILYLGVENRLEVVNLLFDAKIKIRSESGGIKIQNRGKYFSVFVMSKGMKVLQVYAGDEIILSDTFEVRLIPSAVFQLGDIEDSVTTVDEITKNPFLNIILPGCFIKYRFTIKSFEIAVIQDSQYVKLLPREPDSIYIDTIFTIDPRTLRDTILIDTILGSSKYINYGDSLTDRQLEFIKKLKRGDSVLIENIRYSFLNSCYSVYSGFKLTIE